MAFRVSDAEANRLRGMQHLDQVLYIFGLRRHMDYATGIVGESHRVSVQSLSEVLFVEPRQGSAKERGAPSKWRILRAIQRLEEVGLVERDSDFVFKLPLADCGEPRPKTFRTDSAPTTAPNPAPDPAPENPNSNNTVTEQPAPDPAPDPAPGVPDIPHHLWGLGSSSKEEGATAPEGSTARVWRLWVELVGDTQANRSILGKMIAEHGEDPVAEAVATTYTKNPADPVSYLRGCLRPKRRFRA